MASPARTLFVGLTTLLLASPLAAQQPPVPPAAPASTSAKLSIEQLKALAEAQVAIAEKNVEIARADLNRKRLEVDKLESHRVDWEKEMRKELEVVMGREQDELGSVVFNVRQREGRQS